MQTLGDDGGMIMLDALIASLVAALLVGMVLMAGSIMRLELSSAEETRLATVQLQSLMNTTPVRVGEMRVSDRRFEGQVVIRRETLTSASFCRIHSELQARASHRRYHLDGVRWCLAETLPARQP